MFWKPWIVLSVTTERNSKWVGEEWPQFLMGCEEANTRRKNKADSRHNNNNNNNGFRFEFGVAKWVHRENQGQGPGGELVGPTSGGAEPRLGGCVRESLRVELGAGRGGCRGANGCMAAVRGAAREHARDGG